MANPSLKLNKPTQLKILAFGDSLTEGFADYGMTMHPYGWALQKKLSNLLPDHEIIINIQGKSGDTVSPELGNGQFQNRLRQACTAHYDLIIILGGTNDLGYTLGEEDSPTQIFEALKACYDIALGSGASLLCLSIPERAIDGRDSDIARMAKQAREQLNTLIKEYVDGTQEHGKGEQNVYFMDLATVVPFSNRKGANGNESLWSVDGLHMTTDGYDYVGEELGTFIQGLIQ